MASRRFESKPPTNLSVDRSPEDGIDPRDEPKYPPTKVSNRKALQLCRQVERALSGALEGDVLRDLSIVSAMPAPDSSRLLVMVRYHGPDSVPLPEIYAALRAQHARLRETVAASIHRRKTPELVFEVMR